MQAVLRLYARPKLVAGLLAPALLLAACGEATPASSPAAPPSAAASKPAAAASAAASVSAKPAASAAASAKPAASGPASASAKPAASAAAASAYKPTALNPPVKIKFGDPVFSPMAPVYVALDRGYFKDEGLDVELVNMQAGGQTLVVQSVSTNQVQFAMAGPDPALLNAMERGVEVKILAAAVSARPTDKTAQLMVRQDLLDSGKVKGPADLKGMTIAAPAEQSEFYIERYLAKGNLTRNDVTMQRLNLGDILPAFKNKGIDAAWEVEPLCTAAVNQGLAKPVAVTGELLPGAQAQTLVMAPQFGKEQPQAAQKFVNAFVRGVRDYYHAFVKNDGDRAPVAAALSNHTAIKDPKQFDAIGMQSVDPNPVMDPANWDPQQEYFLKRGIEKTRVDMSKYVDQSFLNTALQQLGRES